MTTIPKAAIEAAYTTLMAGLPAYDDDLLAVIEAAIPCCCGGKVMIPAARKNGSARCQFIAEVRRIISGVDQGRAASEGMRDVRRALDVLDRVGKAIKSREGQEQRSCRALPPP